ncbi:MAG: hypothetical protein WBD34_21260 [Burkholderiaceae bacterium]
MPDESPADQLLMSSIVDVVIEYGVTRQWVTNVVSQKTIRFKIATG